MDCQKVGKLILNLRKEKKMTQKQLGDALHLSDRTISKWERGLGCPDVSLLSALSDIFDVNVEKILAGDLAPNEKDGGNMKRIKFHTCPECGNVLTGTGDGEIACCGRKLTPLKKKEPDEAHGIAVEKIENDYYITWNHPMSKAHYLSFAAYVCFDRVLLIKLYPEQSPEIRFPAMRRGKLYVYCTNHGFFEYKL